jgi:acyl-coenzyme A thioesterase PaaI-like protein
LRLVKCNVTAIGSLCVVDAFVFDSSTAVTADGTARIVDGWDIGGNANGGYLMAIVARHMLTVTGRAAPLTVTGHYLAPGTPGTVQLTATVVKVGKRLTTATASMSRGDTTLLHVVGAFTDHPDSPGPTHVGGTPPDLPPLDECVARTRAQGAVDVPLMDRIDVRLRPADAGFNSGRPSGTAEVAGWFGFADGRPIDPLALLLVCDSFPPAVFNLAIAPGWVPTVEYTVHVRGIPAPGPLRCVFRSHYVQGGVLNEDGEVWDSAGKLVALSRQLGLMPRST